MVPRRPPGKPKKAESAAAGGRKGRAGDDRRRERSAGPRPPREGAPPTRRPQEGPARPVREGPPPPRPGRPPPSVDQLEGRNVVREALAASERVKRILVDERALPDPKLGEILSLAARRGVPVEHVGREALDRMAYGRVHNGVIALARPLEAPSLREVLDGCYGAGADPLVMLLDEVQYEQNLGAVLRTGDAAGAHAVVIPTRRGAGLSPVVQRIAMGAAEHVPVVREGIMAALATLRRDGIRVVGAAEDGDVSLWEVDLTGPLALVLGGEDKGITPTVRSRCDVVCRVPMTGHVPSINVSATAAVLLFERLRQVERGPPAVTAGRQPALPDLAEGDEQDVAPDLDAEEQAESGFAWYGEEGAGEEEGEQ
ncbi:23S rRNA (guanosine(2251)-2'-O)-methyltransferase RlmB [Myxococcota bacterium]|nr:23S rRNA (guanosine(2251)-2'-O)-methyltransferase RlmB [Myxococcota bacterium]